MNNLKRPKSFFSKRRKVTALVLNSLAAGICIGIAAIVKSHFGSLSFSVGLLIIIQMKYTLFTGKIGYICRDRNYADLLIMLIFNMIGAKAIGIFYGHAEAAPQEPLWQAFVLSALCGFLVYIAIEAHSALITIAAVFSFVTIGAHHCIAEAFRLDWAALANWLYLFIVTIGNSVGALIARAVQRNRESLV